MGFLSDIGNLVTSAIGDVTSTIGSIISPVSGLIGAGANYLGTQDQIAAAQANQANANAFSAQQYATRYQTTVKDLQAAGLNPMLAAQTGAGSAPTSAPPAPTFNKLGNTATGLLTGAQSAADYMNKRATEEDIYASVDLKHAEMLDRLAHVPVHAADIDVKRATVKNLMQSINESITRSALNTAETANRVADAPLYQARGTYYKKYGFEPEKFTQMGSQIINSAVNAAGAFRGKRPINYQPVINNYEAQ